MLYPRLKVAKELLTDDGVIFVQIDDNELHNLIQIMNEIFGEDNYIGNVIWQHSIQPKGYLGKLSVHHNYLLIYSKNPSFSLGSLDRTEEHNKAYSNPDNDPNGPWRTGDVRNALYRPNLIYDIITPSGKVIKPPQNGWRWSKETVQAKISTGEIIFNKDETNIIRKIYLNSLEGRAPETIWFGKEVGTTRDANKTIKELFENEVPFDTPKPVELLKRVLQLSTLNNSNDIILDFFSGSATTAHAVMQFNAEGEVIGNRRFIMVQLPEVCHENSSAYNLGYKNICEIGKERIRRAGDKIKEEFKDKPGIENLDIGFKVFKVANTNIRWFSEAIKSNILDYDMTMTDKDKLDFNPGFTDIDVVYEILLRHRDIPLTTNVEQLTNIGNRTYIFADTVVVCLEETITEEMINKITAIEPMPTKIIFRDSAFGEDISLKENTMIRLEAQMRKNSGLEKRAYRVEFI
jgi:adenine-specific DNA-methyltransferase